MLNELGGVTYFLYCRIPNLGRMSSTLETERKLAFIVNQSGQDNGLPPAHQMEKQLFHHRFGPMLVELSSKHFMIGKACSALGTQKSRLTWLGGFCRFYRACLCSESVHVLANVDAVTWTATSLPFKIVDLVVEIVQKVGIKPSLDTLGPIETGTIRKTIWSLGEEKEWPNILKGVVYPQDQKIAVSRQARILSGFSPKGALNASHHPYSRSCVMPSTEIVLTLTYEQYEGGTTPNQQQLSQPTIQELQIRSPACLSSCWCLLEYYRLPAYEAEKIEGMRIGEPDNTLPKGPYGFSRCLCAYRELEGHEERDYGVSRAEVEEQWKAEQDGRAWIDLLGHKRDDALPVASS